MTAQSRRPDAPALESSVPDGLAHSEDSAHSAPVSRRREASGAGPSSNGAMGMGRRLWSSCGNPWGGGSGGRGWTTGSFCGWRGAIGWCPLSCSRRAVHGDGPGSMGSAERCVPGPGAVSSFVVKTVAPGWVIPMWASALAVPGPRALWSRPRRPHRSPSMRCACSGVAWTAGQALRSPAGSLELWSRPGPRW